MARPQPIIVPGGLSSTRDEGLSGVGTDLGALLGQILARRKQQQEAESVRGESERSFFEALLAGKERDVEVGGTPEFGAGGPVTEPVTERVAPSADIEQAQALSRLLSATPESRLAGTKSILESLKPKEAPKVETKVLSPDQILVDSSGTTIATGKGKKVTLGEGEQIIDTGTGAVVASTEPAPEKLTLPNVLARLHEQGEITTEQFADFLRSSAGKTVIEKLPAASERKEIADFTSLLDEAEAIESLFDPKYTGFLDNILGRAKEITGLGVEGKEVIFRRIVNNMADRLLRARSGAQINEQEFKRLLKIVPELGLSDKAFVARAKDFTRELKDVLKTKKKTLKGFGLRTPPEEDENRIGRFTIEVE